MGRIFRRRKDCKVSAPASVLPKRTRLY